MSNNQENKIIKNNNTNQQDSQHLISVVKRICDILRNTMEVNNYRDYVLGFLFYKYLSENIEKTIEKMFKVPYKEFQNNKDYEKFKNYLISNKTGFYIEYKYSFQSVMEMINEGQNVIQTIMEAFKSIEDSSKQRIAQSDNAKDNDDFENLFSEVKLDDSKLGKIEADREYLIQKIFKELNSLNLVFDNTEMDIFGNAYEYLLADFASSGGKKAGEFYTPSSVSELLSKIATYKRESIKSAYDPTCGSGSLLLKIAKKVKEKGILYGQEVKQSTYNLARMNLFLRGMKFSDFNVKEGDTLLNPQHADEKFECIVANPPFSLKWQPKNSLLEDERYNSYGVLPPKSYADFAFLMHMLHHVSDDGIIVSVFSLGILERSNAEKNIRKIIIEKNYIDAIIMLPTNIFYNTSIPTCIVVARKNKSPKDKSIFFIDASEEFKKEKKQNSLSQENIDKIFETWASKKEIEYFSRFVQLEEIIENDYSLSISKYIDKKQEEQEEIDLEQLSQEIKDIDQKIQELEKTFEENLSKFKKENPEYFDN